ncbi:hypothetical protein ALO98_05360 [Pseudomonas syringae pv. tagetis]|nr:hypothetical protein ALO98_05360 [Pseudomonas syringae pv. tagetis]
MRDRYEQGVRLNHDLAIAELAGHFHLTRNAGQTFKPITRDHACVVTGAAGNDLHVAYFAEQFGSLWSKCMDQHLLLPQTTFKRALHDLGLLVDFLEHEVTIFALVSGFGTFVVLHYFTLDRHAVDIPDLHAVATDLGNITFFQVHETVGDLAQCQLVRGQEVFTQPHADHQRAAATGGQQAVRLRGIDHSKTIGTVELFHRSLQGNCQIRRVLELVVQQVNNDLSVGLGCEHVPQAFELFTQRFMVLDDAVVDNCQRVSREVWMSVAFTRRTVSGPTRMGNTQTTRQRLACQCLFQFTDLAGATTALKNAFVGENGHACAVIAAVFKAFETFEQNGRDITFSNGADDSTHGSLLADSGTNQIDAAGLYLIAGLAGQAIISNKGMDTAPGQLQIGYLATYLVGFDHDDDFPGDFRHDPAQAQQLVKSGGTTNQIDAVGTDKQLIKVVGAQYLLRDLPLKRLRVRIPRSASHQQDRFLLELSEGSRYVQGVGHDDQTGLLAQLRDQRSSGAAAVDNDSGVLANSANCRAGDGLFVAGNRLTVITYKLVRERHCAPVTAQQQAIGFKGSQILSNRNFGGFKALGQIIDTDFTLLIEQSKNVMAALRRIALRHDGLKFRFER